MTYHINKKSMVQKHQEHKQRVRQLQEDALAESRKLARLLVEQFDIEKVFLTGPLIYGEFRGDMPLELAADGIQQGEYASAFAFLRNASEYRVELIDLQHADSWTTRAVREQGRLLAEKKNSTS